MRECEHFILLLLFKSCEDAIEDGLVLSFFALQESKLALEKDAKGQVSDIY